MASCVITGHLLAALRRTVKIRSGDHSFLIVEGRYDILRRHAEVEKTALGEVRAAASKPDE